MSAVTSDSATSRVHFWNTMCGKNLHTVVDEIVGGKAVFINGVLDSI
jgi:hypothetical protein